MGSAMGEIQVKKDVIFVSELESIGLRTTHGPKKR
jgi:hypothetical protein